MGRWIAALKKHENGPETNPQNLQNPIPAGFEGFEGSPSGHIANFFDPVDWTDEDWQAAYDERAGILEYVEGLPRAEAERLAREQVFGNRPTGEVILSAVSIAGGRS